MSWILLSRLNWYNADLTLSFRSYLCKVAVCLLLVHKESLVSATERRSFADFEERYLTSVPCCPSPSFIMFHVILLQLSCLCFLFSCSGDRFAILGPCFHRLILVFILVSSSNIYRTNVERSFIFDNFSPPLCSSR